MSHQVNFFLDPTDTRNLESELRSLGPLLVLHSRSPSAKPRVVDSVSFEEEGRPWLFFHLVRPEDLDAVVTRHVPAQGYWVVDEQSSPVVQFIRCGFDGRILRRGRLYYVDAIHGPEGEQRLKSEAFRSWAKKVLAVAKKGLRREGFEYIGPGADAWVGSSGGKLG